MIKLRQLSSRPFSFDADKTSFLRIYFSLIRLKIKYGCIVYSNHIESKELAKFDSIYNSAVRLPF